MKQIVSRGHTRPLTEISFVEDGEDRTILVSSAHDKTPQIRNGETGDWIGTFHGHKGAVWSAKVDSLTRTLAATASGDFSSKLWCVNTGKELHEFKHKHVVKSVDFSSDTLQIATGCQDGSIRVFSTCQPDSAPQEIKIISSPTDGIMKVSWTPNDRNLLMVCKKSGSVEKWDIRDPQAAPVQSVNLGTNLSVMDCEASPKHNIILCASGTKVISLALDSLSVLKEFAMPSPLTFKDEGGVSLSSDGSKFYTGGSDLWLREFDYQTGENLRTFKGHHGPIRCLRVHPRNDMCASGSEDGTIRLWDLALSTDT